VLSVASMLRRMFRAMKFSAKEENFAVVAGAAVSLILVGTVAYSLGEGWNVVDGFYFAVCTLTTSSIADPKLTLTHDALKLFTHVSSSPGIAPHHSPQLWPMVLKSVSGWLRATGTVR